jgi:hypothetical protein
MKKLIILSAFFLAVGLQSCEDPKAPECKLAVSYNPVTDLITCDVSITEDNGSKFFSDEGLLISFHSTPMRADNFTEEIQVNKNSKERKFQYTFVAQELDTTYYIKAYVKSNYGTGYSEIESVHTDLTRPIADTAAAH